MKRITVLGANGYTAKLICEALEEQGTFFQAALRDPSKLTAYKCCQKVFTVDVFSVEDLRAMLLETEILINCVGPFALFGEKVIEEVSKHSIDYLDITGEQSFVKKSYDLKNNKATLIHSCSFESALVDLMAFQLLNSKSSYEFIRSLYQFDTGGPSPGTRFTMKIHSFFDQYRVREGVLETYHEPFALRNLAYRGLEEWRFALSTPYPETIFFSHNFRVNEAASFVMVEESMLEFSLNNNLASNKTLEQVVEKNTKVYIPGPSEEDRKKQRGFIILESKEEDGPIKTMLLRGHDFYAVTAKLIVFATNTLLTHDLPRGVVLSPGEAFHAHGMLEAMIKECHMDVLTY